MNLRNRKMIEEKYKEYCGSGDGIERHLPYLRKLSDGIDVIELGVDVGKSSTAFLLSADHLTSVDKIITRAADKLLKAAGPDWKYYLKDTRLLNDIEPADLVFFDTCHTYDHLQLELIAYYSKAKSYMVFHDTITFGSHGESYFRPGNKNPHPGERQPYHMTLGIRPAIDEFMIMYPEWRVERVSTVGHGLLTLKKEAR